MAHALDCRTNSRADQTWHETRRRQFAGHPFKTRKFDTAIKVSHQSSDESGCHTLIAFLRVNSLAWVELTHVAPLEEVIYASVS